MSEKYHEYKSSDPALLLRNPQDDRKLKLYHNLLLKWQQKINLISNDTIENAWQRNFTDSLQLILHLNPAWREAKVQDPVPRILLPQDLCIVDLGSGAGFPAMVLAVAGYKNVHLIESDSRKCAFLQEVARVTETSVTIHNKRIEKFFESEEYEILCSSLRPSQDLVLTSRACASLDKLFDLIHKKISRETICLFHKGKNYSKECEEASKNWEYNMSATPSIAQSESFIVKISDLKKREYGNQKN